MGLAIRNPSNRALTAPFCDERRAVASSRVKRCVALRCQGRSWKTQKFCQAPKKKTALEDYGIYDGIFVLLRYVKIIHCYWRDGRVCHVESSLVTSGGTSLYGGILDPSRSTIELPGSGPTGAMGQALGVWHCGLDMKGLGRKTIKGNSKRSESLRRNSSVFGYVWK